MFVSAFFFPRRHFGGKNVESVAQSLESVNANENIVERAISQLNHFARMPYGNNWRMLLASGTRGVQAKKNT